MGRGRKGITEQSQRKPKRTDSANHRGETIFAFVKNRDKKNNSTWTCRWLHEEHESTTACRFSFANDWQVKTSSCFRQLNRMQIQVCYDGAKYFTHHVITIVSYFFRLFHRLDNFICYISDIFLPSRQRKFGNNVPYCVYQHNHFIFSWFI